MYDIFIEYRVTLTAICVGLIGALFTIYVQRRNAFRSAALSFRNAFIEELNALESIANKEVSARDILVKSFEKHRNAVAEFRLHLGFIQRRSFDATWKEHYLSGEYDEIRKKCGIPAKDHIYLQYLWSSQDDMEDAGEIASAALAVKNIKALLNYAKP